MVTKLMGVLNVTPDSFFADSRCSNTEEAIKRGLKIYKEGADIIDVGGESTRPGAAPLTIQEELERVIPVIQSLTKEVPIPLSIDTMHPKVADKALIAGAKLINDVSGFRHPEMKEIAASSQALICVVHMQGVPETMQNLPHYPDGGVLAHLLRWFDETINSLLQAGVKEDSIYIDPGIGFGKTVADNVEILHNLRLLKSMGFPVVLGISRKSFMTKLLNNQPPSQLLPATIAINSIAILEKIDIIRVHDVYEHRSVIDILEGMAKFQCGATHQM